MLLHKLLQEIQLYQSVNMYALYFLTFIICCFINWWPRAVFILCKYSYSNGKMLIEHVHTMYLDW